MLKTVGMVCYSVSSINMFSSIIEDLSKVCRIKLYTLCSYAEKSMKQFNKLDNVHILNQKDYKGIDLLLYSTGSSNSLELEIPLELEDTGIPCVAFQDTFWESKEDYSMRYSYLPNNIIVPTLVTKDDIISATRICSNRVHVLGNPYFDQLKDVVDKTSGTGVSYISNCDTGGSYNEPTHPSSREDILILLSMLNRGFIQSLKIFKHPRENMNFYNEFSLVPEKTNDLRNILDCRIVIGRDNTLIYESMLLDKDVIITGTGDLEIKVCNQDYDTLNNNIYLVENSTELVIDYLINELYYV